MAVTRSLAQEPPLNSVASGNFSNPLMLQFLLWKSEG